MMVFIAVIVMYVLNPGFEDVDILNSGFNLSTSGMGTPGHAEIFGVWEFLPFVVPPRSVFP